MIEEDFYSHIKLITGEELFAKVSVSEEETRTFLLLSNPVILATVKAPNTDLAIGFRLEPWMKFGREDLFMVTMDKVITISESKDEECIELYENFVRNHQMKTLHRKKHKDAKMTRDMGYISSVKEARSHLEKMFKLNEKTNSSNEEA